MIEILVVDDERKITEVIESYLNSKGYKVHVATSGKSAFEFLEIYKIDLLILDLMLPDMSGEEICGMIRASNIERIKLLPIIMLSAKAQEADIIEGLKTGADDYMVKPFSLKELHVRIETIMRRLNISRLHVKPSFWTDNHLSVDITHQKVSIENQMISLTNSELKILMTLMDQPSRVYTREQLINSVFGEDFNSYDRAIDTHIKNLRHKIEKNPKEPNYIKTVYGIGYKFGGEK